MAFELPEDAEGLDFGKIDKQLLNDALDIIGGATRTWVFGGEPDRNPPVDQDLKNRHVAAVAAVGILWFRQCQGTVHPDHLVEFVKWVAGMARGAKPVEEPQA